MKHFGNAYGTLKVRENGESGSIYITIDSQESFAGVGIEDAPALALAILEAAGWPEADPNSATRTIMQDLRCVVEFDERKAKEAADREALEAEALELYRVFYPSTNHASINNVMPSTARDFIALASKARELHKAVS